MEFKNCIYIPFFQEAGPHLERLLESLENWNIKKAYFVDGPFPTFPHDHDISTDGSREIIKGYDFSSILDAGVNFMPIKTNLVLHRAAKYGYSNVLIMGCDEYLEGDWNSIPPRTDSPMTNVHVEEHNPTGRYNTVENVNPRVVCWPGLVRSIDIHWMLFFNNQSIDNESLPTIEGITIHSDDTFRPDSRDKLMTEYQDKNVPREMDLIREKYIKQIVDWEYPPVISASGNRYWTCGCITRKDGARLLKCKKHENISPKL
jgi:hypothetical protein